MCVCGSAFGVCVSESFPSPLLASHIIYSSQKLLFTNCLWCVSNMIKWNNTICEKNAHMNKLESPELRFVSFQFVVRALCVFLLVLSLILLKENGYKCGYLMRT